MGVVSNNDNWFDRVFVPQNYLHAQTPTFIAQALVVRRALGLGLRVGARGSRGMGV